MTAHEELCAERYQTIAAALKDLKDDSKDQHKLLWGVLLAVAGVSVTVLVAIVLKAANLS